MHRNYLMTGYQAETPDAIRAERAAIAEDLAFFRTHYHGKPERRRAAFQRRDILHRHGVPIIRPAAIRAKIARLLEFAYSPIPASTCGAEDAAGDRREGARYEAEHLARLLLALDPVGVATELAAWMAENVDSLGRYSGAEFEAFPYFVGDVIEPRNRYLAMVAHANAARIEEVTK